MTTREILTLQFGHYSNYVGTHWWNIQEQSFSYDPDKPSEINHDVLFREGLTDKGQTTFTPRCLLVDLKGSLKSLPEHGTLYEPPVDPKKLDPQWNLTTDIKQEGAIPKSNYQEELDGLKQKDYTIEEDVRVWSDFMYTRFHPRTVNVIKEYQHENDSNPFNVFPMGSNLWKTDDFQEDFCDKIRNYVEESDSFQGFQVLLDATDGFGGLSSGALEHIYDEYEQKSVFALPLIPSHYSDYSLETERHKSILYDSFRVLNLGICFYKLMEHSSLFVPLCTGKSGWRQPGLPKQFNHVSYNSKLWYHSSAILATALDTFTLLYRLRGNAYSISDLATDLTPHGRKLVAASLCLPFSLNHGADLIDCLDNWDGPLSQSITPNCNIGNSRMMQLVTLRGVNESRLKSSADKAGKQKDMPAYKCKNITEMLKMYYAYTYHASATNVTSIETSLAVKKPFPMIFDERLNAQGNVIPQNRPSATVVESVPVLSGLHSGTEIGHMVESLHTEMKKIKFQKFHQYLNAGIDLDEYNEILDKLFDFRECYEDSYLI